MDIAGTTAIVTGAASGLGAATAAELAERGARVIGVDLPSAIDAAAPVAGLTYVGTDVTDPAGVRSAVQEATETGTPLRIVVNCAGIAPAARVVGRGGAHDSSLFAAVVSVNLIGTFNVLSIAADAIARQEAGTDGQRGVIVNTASIAAYDGQVGQAAYAASKGGIVSLTLPAARDLAQYGIRVCAIAPGVMDTPMLAAASAEVREALAAGIPFPQRLGRPDEFARLVAVIVEHDYLNGETIRMDGALRMPPRSG